MDFELPPVYAVARPCHDIVSRRALELTASLKQSAQMLYRQSCNHLK